MSIALIAGELQAQVVIYDNLSPTGGNAFFNSNTAGINEARYLLGEDISTVTPINSTDSWRLDNVNFNMVSFGNGTSSETFTDVMVEVSLWGNITGTGTGGALGDSLAASFGIAPLLGSETFSLGNITTGAAGQNTVESFALNFTNNINIGSGQNIGITFELFDSVTAPLMNRRSDRLAVAYRADTQATNSPVLGTTSDRNFRDRAGAVGRIDGTIDDFGFSSDAALRFSLEATAVPEPTSLAVLGFIGLGLCSRRRR